MLRIYRGLNQNDKILFWVVSIVSFIVAFSLVSLLRRNVDMAALTQVSLVQVIAASVAGALIGFAFLLLRDDGENIQVNEVPSEELRDLIYFDVDKATSIYSQIEGGLLTEKQEATEGATERRQLTRVGLKVIQPEVGVMSSEKTSVLESKVLHHDLLNRLEQKLGEMGLLLNLNEGIVPQSSDYSDESLHELVSKPSFIVAEGWVSIEDYNRFKNIASDFKALVAFLNKCRVHSIEQSAEFRNLQEALRAVREEVKEERNGQRKAQMKFQLKSMEEQINGLLRTGGTIDDDVPDWLLEGIQSFIDTFMTNRINLRLYPFEQNSDFEVLSNLKRDYFVDTDLENVMFAYGTRPNILLTVFGLITSVPSKDGKLFDPMEGHEIQQGPDDGEKGQFETAFRQVFRSFESFEQLVRFSQYPKVTIYPIAVYQNLNKIVIHSKGEKSQPNGSAPSQQLSSRMEVEA